MENWRDIPGYSGIYQVSDLGRVRSRYKRGARKTLSEKYRLLKCGVGPTGYPIVHLYHFHTDIRKTSQVHRLVADVFLGYQRTPEKIEVNHLNGVKTDSRVDNLEWCTPSENMKHAYANGLSKRPPIKRKLTDEQVLEIYLTQERNINPKLAKKYGVDTSTICNIRNGKINQEAVCRALKNANN